MIPRGIVEKQYPDEIETDAAWIELAETRATIEKLFDLTAAIYKAHIIFNTFIYKAIYYYSI